MHENIIQVVMIPVVNGLVEVAKRAGLPKRYCPLLAVALGIVAGIGLLRSSETLPFAILEGLVIGLSAVGMYSGTRNVLQNNNGNQP